jgi:hypothetical protein
MADSRIQIAGDDDLKTPFLEIDTAIALAESRVRDEDSELQEQFISQFVEQFEKLEAVILQMSSHLQAKESNSWRVARRIYAFLFFVMTALIVSDVFAWRNANAADQDYADFFADATRNQSQRLADFRAASIPGFTDTTCGYMYDCIYNSVLRYPLVYSADQSCNALSDSWMNFYDTLVKIDACYIDEDYVCPSLVYCSSLVKNVCQDYISSPDNQTVVSITIGAGTAIGLLALAIIFNKRLLANVKQRITNLGNKKLDSANDLLHLPNYEKDPAVLLKSLKTALDNLVESNEGRKILRLAFLRKLGTGKEVQLLRTSPMAEPALIWGIFAYSGILSDAQIAEDIQIDARRVALVNNSIFRQATQLPSITDAQSYTTPEFKP